MGDSLSIAYPEMVKRIFPTTFKETSRHKQATVEVTLDLRNDNSTVYGKIAAHINYSTSINFRVGSMLLARTEGVDEPICSNSDGKVQLERSVVVVPSGWVLCIDVDLHVKTGNNSKATNLKGIVNFDSNATGRIKGHPVKDDNNFYKVHVMVTWGPEQQRDDIDKQLSPPVQILEMASGHPTIVYTIGDELSFIEFIMALRRLLADHRDHEDILDGHRLLNLSSTREHPLLAKQCAEVPKRWIKVKLKVVDGNRTSSSTTLFIKADNVYVHGFKNHKGVVYELLRKPPPNRRNWRDLHMLPEVYEPKPLYWDVKYSSILNLEGSGEVVRKLKEAGLGCVFAKKAVRMLSSYDDNSSADAEKAAARLALAGLIFMIPESARMNPIFKSFACGWNSNNGFTEQLMRDYVWGYGIKSGELRGWKSRQYAEPLLLPHYPIKELEAIYLVLNTHGRQRQAGNEENDNNHHPKPDDDRGNEDRKRRRESSYDDRGFSSPSCQQPNNTGGFVRHGNYNVRHDRYSKRARNDDCSVGPQSQQKKASNAAGSGGAPASHPGDGEAGDAGTGGGSRSRPEKADDAVSDGDSAASQPSQNPSGGGGSARQPSDGSEGGSDPSGGNSGSQPREADGAQYNGRPRVELLNLAVRSHLCVVGMTIVVFDGKRGQFIYEEKQGQPNKEEQGGWVDLDLTGPDVGISAYGCFVIRIEIPELANPIRWEWDCYSPKHAAQVDKLDITEDIDDKAKVTYAVMSNAREATVQVKLRLKDGHIPSCVSGGKITALIDGFEARSVLFKHAQGTGQCLSPTDDDEDGDSWFLLQLARNLVAVPCGSALRIEVDRLQIVTEEGNGVEVKVPLSSFDNGICSSKIKTDDGNEVKLEVTWYPEIARPTHPPDQITIKEIDEHKFIADPSEKSGPPEISLPSHPPEEITIEEADEQKYITPLSEQSGHPLEVKIVSGHLTIVYTIGDELSFTEFIVTLRRILADHPDHEDILDHHHSSIHSSTREHPVLAKQHAEQPARWIHIKLRAVTGSDWETSSTTLLMRDDNLYICGFINQDGDSFELIDNPDKCTNILPVGEYKPRRLSWGVGYRCLLDADTQDDLVAILVPGKVGWRDFVMDAVHVLSRFPARDSRQNPRVALAGLAVMVCDSARMNPIFNFFTRSWGCSKYDYDRMEMEFNHWYSPKNLMRHYVFYYGKMSCELWTWKSKKYANPLPVSQLQDIYLVLNYPLGTPQQKGTAESSSSRGRSTLGNTGRRRLKGHGRPRVELLAIRADLEVVGTTIVVFDGKRGHIIYTKEEHEEKGIIDLVLTGPCTSISAYVCFAIKIDIPAAAADRSKADRGGSIKWEWDCYNPEYAKEVDKPPMPRTISSGPGRNIEVTYAVMSNALEATMQVKMRRLDGNRSCSVHGNITACIGDFKDQIVLFRHTQGTGQRLSPTDSWVLQLARSVLAVPSSKQLHIEMDLHIEIYSDNRGPILRHFKTAVDFPSGISNQHRHKVDGNEIEVNVTWYPDVSREIIRPPLEREINRLQRQPDISYIIGDSGEEFRTFIMELRRLVADHPRRKDVLEEHPDPVRSATRNHPVLPIGRALRHSRVRSLLHIEQLRWLLHIELHAGSGVEETPSITLVMRVDTLDIMGFMNQKGDWYVINRRFTQMLPEEYKPTDLDWGYSYDRTLGVGIWEEMNSKSLGKTFAVDAVSVLSRFVRTEVEAGGDNPKQALVGLMFLICESARINPVHDHIVRGWENGTRLTEQLMGYVERWPEMSRALLDWKDRVYSYNGWPRNKQLENVGINTPEDALDIVHLVHNDPERLAHFYYY